MDEYLKIVLEQIRCKKARPYIRQELQDHIEDQIEANVSAGLNRTDAEKEAVKIWVIRLKQDSLLTGSISLRLHGSCYSSSL